MSYESTEIIDDILEMVITPHSGGDAFAFQNEPPVKRKNITCEVHLKAKSEWSGVKIDPTSVDGNSIKTSEIESETLLTPTLEESIIDCTEKSPTLQSLVTGYVSSLSQLWADRCKRETLRKLNPSWTSDGDEITQLRETVIVQGLFIKELRGEKMRLTEEKQRYVRLVKDSHVEMKDDKGQVSVSAENVTILDEKVGKKDENKVILDNLDENVISSIQNVNNVKIKVVGISRNNNRYIESKHNENVKGSSVKDVYLSEQNGQNPQDLGGNSDDEIVDNKAEILDAKNDEGVNSDFLDILSDETSFKNEVLISKKKRKLSKIMSKYEPNTKSKKSDSGIQKNTPKLKNKIGMVNARVNRCQGSDRNILSSAPTISGNRSRIPVLKRSEISLKASQIRRLQDRKQPSSLNGYRRHSGLFNRNFRIKKSDCRSPKIDKTISKEKNKIGTFNAQVNRCQDSESNILNTAPVIARNCSRIPILKRSEIGLKVSQIRRLQDRKQPSSLNGLRRISGLLNRNFGMK